MFDFDICVICEKVVRPRQQALQCDQCDRWQHRICDTSISQAQCRELVKGTEQRDDFQMKCFNCECNDAYATLKTEREAELHNMVRLVARKKLYRHQSKVVKSRQEALQTLWAKYDETDRISTSEYLRRRSELMTIA
ncbi:hypothetical protein LSAT2_015051 [Lamellibrachia satsuma]|nr:hypothetical protein LSAT2_015051 [Lamellibrachia satsuma]